MEDDGKKAFLDEQEEHPESNETSSCQRALDISALRQRARFGEGTATSSIISSYRDRSPVARTSTAVSDDSEGKQTVQEKEVAGEPGDEEVANPMAAIPPAEQPAVIQKKRVHRFAASRTAADIDLLIGATSDHMMRRLEQKERAYQQRERKAEGRRQFQKRSLTHQERSLQLQERSLQELRRLNATLEMRTGLLGQMVDIFRAALGGRGGGVEEGAKQGHPS